MTRQGQRPPGVVQVRLTGGTPPLVTNVRRLGGPGGGAGGAADHRRDGAAPVTHVVSFAEPGQRRWGPGGRAHFANPRPGDFPGRENKPEPHPEPEQETR